MTFKSVKELTSELKEYQKSKQDLEKKLHNQEKSFEQQMEKLNVFAKEYDNLKQSVQEELFVSNLKTEKEKKDYFKKQIEEISKEEVEIER